MCHCTVSRFTLTRCPCAVFYGLRGLGRKLDSTPLHQNARRHIFVPLCDTIAYLSLRSHLRRRGTEQFYRSACFYGQLWVRMGFGLYWRAAAARIAEGK
jgi:hypothetical protein